MKEVKKMSGKKSHQAKEKNIKLSSYLPKRLGSVKYWLQFLIINKKVISANKTLEKLCSGNQFLGRNSLFP